MSAAVDIAKELMGTVGRLASLETRTADVARQQERIEAKLDSLIDRLARIEADYKHLRENVKNEIMSEIGRELTKVQVILDLQAKGMLPPGLLLGEKKSKSSGN
jgi:uncharacterized protein (UPF0335 family)